MGKLKEWLTAQLFAYLATKEKFDITKKVDCGTCKGAGFDPRLTSPSLGDYDRVCGECAGQSTVESVYLRRWYLYKSNFFNVMLHNIKRSDDDPDPHDHPWSFVSVILKNGYMDEQYRFVPTQHPEKKYSGYGDDRYEQRTGLFARETNDRGEPVRHFEPRLTESRGVRSGPYYQKVRPGMVIYRSAEHIHRVIIKDGKEAWTLVFARGDRRPWGFIKRTAWVFWRKYLNAWSHKHV